jgi:hypothetical protein
MNTLRRWWLRSFRPKVPATVRLLAADGSVVASAETMLADTGRGTVEQYMPVWFPPRLLVGSEAVVMYAEVETSRGRKRSFPLGVLISPRDTVKLTLTWQYASFEGEDVP